MQQIYPSADASVLIGDQSQWDTSDTSQPQEQHQQQQQQHSPFVTCLATVLPPVTVQIIVQPGACSQPGTEAPVSAAQGVSQGQGWKQSSLHTTGWAVVGAQSSSASHRVGNVVVPAFGTTLALLLSENIFLTVRFLHYPLFSKIYQALPLHRALFLFLPQALDSTRYLACSPLPQISSQSRIHAILATSLLSEIILLPRGCTSCQAASPQPAAASPTKGTAIASLKPCKDFTLVLEQPAVTKETHIPAWLIQQLPTWGQAGEGGLVLGPPAGSVWGRCGSQAAKCRAIWWEELSCQSSGWTEVLVSRLLVRVRLLVPWPAVALIMVEAAKLWPLHNLLLRKQTGEFKPPSPSASVHAAGLAWSRWDSGCGKHSTGCPMAGDARPMGIAVAAESCLPASSACCASPPGVNQHHGAMSCSATCARTYPGANCPSAQPRQGCHLCHQGNTLRRWLVPQESGWHFGNGYQALESHLWPQNTMTWHTGHTMTGMQQDLYARPACLQI